MLYEVITGDFDSDGIFDSGQCFRWYKKEGRWQGISLDKQAAVKSIEVV